MSRSGINKVIVVGNVGQEPDVKQTTNGGTIVNLSIATSESWKGKDGNQQERTEWHRVVFFNRLAEIVEQYIKKGSKVYIEGSLRTRKWQTPDNQDRYTTEIVASEMQMLDSRGGATGEGSGVKTRFQSAESGQSSPQATNNSSQGFDDDIPF